MSQNLMIVPHFDRTKIIVSADDYGLRSTADFIVQLAQQGKVDRVSVLVNYVSHEEAEALKKTGVKIDLHLELIKLIGSGEKIKESALSRGIKFITRRMFGFATRRKVEEEWRFQIDRFRDIFGRLPDGINSHEHVHYFSPFFRIFLTLAHDYNIPYVRFGRRVLPFDFHRPIVAAVVAFFWKRNRRFFATDEQSLSATDLFISYDWFDDFAEVTTLLAQSAGNVEVVFHPERKDEYVVIEQFL